MLPRIKQIRLRLVKDPFDEPKAAKKDKPDREFAVGGKLRIKLLGGRIVDATFRAIVDDEAKLQVDFGHEETALVKPSEAVD